MQEVVDAALLERVETSIERNKSLQMLYMWIRHNGVVVDAILKGARGNTSLKTLIIRLYSELVSLKAAAAAAAAAAELQQVKPQLKFTFH